MSSLRQLAIPVLLWSLVLSATSPGQSDTAHLVLGEGVRAHPQIDSLYYRFSQAYRTLNASVIAEIYAEEALYLSPDSEIRKGGDVIHESFALSFLRTKERGEQREIAFTIVEREVSGPLAYDVGVFTLTRHSKDGETGISRGKFVVIARRGEDGAWRFQVDAYSDIL